MDGNEANATSQASLQNSTLPTNASEPIAHSNASVEPSLTETTPVETSNETSVVEDPLNETTPNETSSETTPIETPTNSSISSEGEVEREPLYESSLEAHFHMVTGEPDADMNGNFSFVKETETVMQNASGKFALSVEDAGSPEEKDTSTLSATFVLTPKDMDSNPDNDPSPLRGQVTLRSNGNDKMDYTIVANGTMDIPKIPDDVENAPLTLVNNTNSSDVVGGPVTNVLDSTMHIVTKAGKTLGSYHINRPPANASVESEPEPEPEQQSESVAAQDAANE